MPSSAGAGQLSIAHTVFLAGSELVDVLASTDPRVTAQRVLGYRLPSIQIPLLAH